MNTSEAYAVYIGSDTEPTQHFHSRSLPETQRKIGQIKQANPNKLITINEILDDGSEQQYQILHP